MSYSETPANETPQIGSNSFHKPVKIETELIVLPAAFILAWYAAGLIIGLLAACVVRFTFWRIAKEIRQEQIRAQAVSFVTIRGPHVVPSLYPDQPAEEVEQAAQRFRYMIMQSEHPFREQIAKQIYAMPYRPLLSDAGQLFQSWDEYILHVAAFHHQKRMEWYERGCPANLKSMYAGVLGVPKQPEI